MKTSNFSQAGKLPGAICIAVGVPRWFPRILKYPELAPTRDMLKMDEADYAKHYQEILDKLDPAKVFDDLCRLAGGDEPILLCWEQFNVRCHRRWVAEWLEEKLGVVIPELGHERSESIPFVAQKRKSCARCGHKRCQAYKAARPMSVEQIREEIVEANG